MVKFKHTHKVISMIDSCRHYNSSVSALWASSVQHSHKEQNISMHKLFSCLTTKQVTMNSRQPYWGYK